MSFRFRRVSVLPVLLIPVFAAATENDLRGGERLSYPQTRRGNQVDNYHGIQVADPYRWLEADVRQSQEVARWVAAQNRLTFSYLGQIPQRKRIRQRLRELWNFEKYSSPVQRGGRYYFFKNDGLQNQSVLYVMDSLNDTPRVLIDPNRWSKDGTVALTGVEFSPDGRYAAYGIAEAGSDWRTWRVMEIASRKRLPEELKWVKFSNVSWRKDGSGFYYSRYDEPKKGQQFQTVNLRQKLMFHRVGTPQQKDEIVYQRPDHPEWGFQSDVTEDGRYLVITVWKGTDDKYRILSQDLQKPGSRPVDLIATFDHEFTFLGNDGPLFYFQTDADAPRRRVIAIDVNHPGRSRWREIIPQQKETLHGVSLVGDYFVARYLQDAHTEVRLHDLQGRFVRRLKLPGIGTAAGFAGRRASTETFFSFQSFATPARIYRYDAATGKSSLFRLPQVKFDPADYTVRQIFFRSKDGTRVPMFIAHKKGIRLNGNNPTLLYGYGGFNISLTPRFSVGWLAWMEMGGVFALANLRGGGEYGEEWHRAGTKQNKQNVFDDFIAAAEWLIAHKYTNSRRLAIQGGSNGGLLVGAVMTQRPELFGAALPAVGVMDMLRFHKFTAGRFWVDDYGSSDNPDEFRALYAYSPYHNLKAGVHYPATLITTADTDDRVVPGHSFKFAARLQHCQAGKAPVLIRIETRAGHGAGKPTEKIIDELADKWAFLVKNLRMQLPAR